MILPSGIVCVLRNFRDNKVVDESGRGKTISPPGFWVNRMFHSAQKKIGLYLISDSSGNLLEHFFNAVLTQFPRRSFAVRTLSFIKSEEALIRAIQAIRGGIVFHGLISGKLKSSAARECEKRGIACWDVTGPTVHFLEKAAGIKPSRIPKSLHAMDTGYLSRIAALEFTLQHDDSRRIEDLERAEIILVGISRVSKSPNALFLAYRGFRVANISIVPSQGLPLPLEKHTRKNVVALTLQPRRLKEIRDRRFAGWNLEEMNYNEQQNVIREVLDAEMIYKSKKWPVIDTTELEVEETSALILSNLNLKPKAFEWKK